MAKRELTMKPGGGGKFKKLERSLSNEKGIRDPYAVAAAAGRKKYGAAKMTKFAEKGKERAEKK
jgi:hypothetical protein